MPASYDPTWPSRSPLNCKRYRVARYRGVQFNVPADGPRNQVRALVANGWPCVELARRLGITRSSLSNLTHSRRMWARSATALTVGEMYRELRFVEPPFPPGARSRAQSYARRYGWASVDDLEYGPLPVDVVDVDLVVVERRLDGEPLTLSAEERFEAYRQLRDRGVPGVQIAKALHLSGQRQQSYRLRYLEAQQIEATGMAAWTCRCGVTGKSATEEDAMRDWHLHATVKGCTKVSSRALPALVPTQRAAGDYR
jgi:hypothetical protein